jgi:hypothetical protein
MVNIDSYTNKIIGLLILLTIVGALWSVVLNALTNFTGVTGTLLTIAVPLLVGLGILKYVSKSA